MTRVDVLAALHAFIAQARDENAILERNGAVQAAQARGRLLADLENVLASQATETFTVEQAAALTGCNPETVRRAVRDGDIPDLRTIARGTIHVRGADLDYLRGKARKVPPAPEDTASRAIAALARL